MEVAVAVLVARSSMGVFVSQTFQFVGLAVTEYQNYG